MTQEQYALVVAVALGILLAALAFGAWRRGKAQERADQAVIDARLAEMASTLSRAKVEAGGALVPMGVPLQAPMANGGTMDYQVLRAELLTDPLGRGYAGMTDAQAADSLSAVNRTISRAQIQAWEIVTATVFTELSALSATNRAIYQLLIEAAPLPYTDANVRAIAAGIFGAGTVTRANLLAMQNQTVSRAAELGLGTVMALDVMRARLGTW